MFLKHYTAFGAVIYFCGTGNLEINLNGIVIVVGNYGSGKTEVAVNLALYKRLSGTKVRITDLDLVNPYFRTREARAVLSENQIDIVLPPDKYLNADLPVLSPVVAGMIKKPWPLTILDAGGDDAGATVLASLAGAFGNAEYRMIQVVNPYRPFTDSIKGCFAIKKEIENASKMKINGIGGNANLIDETNAEHIYEGYEFVREFSQKSGLPLEFITAPYHLIPKIDLARFNCPVLPVKRQMIPPWKVPVKKGRNKGPGIKI